MSQAKSKKKKEKRLTEKNCNFRLYFKELIQNAEDSGATKVKFYVDYTEYPRLTLLDPGLNKFQVI